MASSSSSSVENLPPEEEEPRRTYITIKIWTQDGDLFYGRVNPRSKLAKFMAAHMRHKPLDNLDRYEYLVDGRPIRPSQTAEEVGLEDGDQMDAMVRQSGGSASV